MHNFIVHFADKDGKKKVQVTAKSPGNAFDFVLSYFSEDEDHPVNIYRIESC